jgi:glycosyltransferase involved in cell wall biosynthesis
MKIAYVIDTNISSSNSIVNKIESKIKLWKEESHEVKVFSLLSDTSESIMEDGVVCQVKKANSKFIYISAVKKLKSFLKTYKPDIIYTRYIRYIPGLVGALKISGSNYIVEINTNDVEENKLSSLKKNIYNQMTRSYLLNNSIGFVHVTNELKNSYDFSKFNKKGIVIPNGIDTNKFLNYPNQKSEPTRIVFIGTAGQDWQGFEKVIYLAGKLKKYNFDIIGINEIDLKEIEIKDISKNVYLHGFLPLEENMKIISNASIGIGTLSLYKKNMQEACALKTRQYLAQGLPIILGYKDTDLLDKKLDFVLELENEPKNIINNIERINSFIEKMSVYDNLIIKKFAINNLDVVLKEKTRLKFMKELIYDKS